MLEITIQVPNDLAQKLQPFQDRLPEVLERGLQELLVESLTDFQDENQIIELLISQPTPEQVLAIRPSPEFQVRTSELLAKSKSGDLLPQEENELERYLTLEHLVRLAKAHAYKQLATST